MGTRTHPNVLVGDCRKQLAKLADASIDAIVTDPPYELGFMGKSWDAAGVAYSVELWRECLRVLKPGGHLLSFGGTRTYHRMACAIEDAGFEIRDSIHWLYGSGFPKSLDVSKAIDKAAGAERELVGSRVTGKARTGDGWQGGQQEVPITAPATDAARQWEGWGTALKPAHEPIVVARKPLVGTVAANVLEHGTGALNIDGCRVAHGSDVDLDAVQRQQHTSGSGWSGMQKGIVGTEIATYKPAGRWPANLVFTHAAECVCVTPASTETTTAEAELPDIRGGKMHAGADRGTVTRSVASYADTPGVWWCAPGCPIAALDAQSGVSKSSGAGTKCSNRDADGKCLGHRNAGRSTTGETFHGPEGDGTPDAGGASRFFTVTEWDEVPFRYVAKPSKKERNAGTEHLPVVTGSVPGPPKHGYETPTWSGTNFHPTVKPVELMRWLVRLVTPPGGIVLDPFLGSGTTAVASILEGRDWRGCELTDEYLPIIRGRVAWAEKQRAAEQPQLPLGDAA